MKVYSIMERPAAAGSDPDFAVIKDGFNWWAFFLPPIWLLLRRQWLGLLAFVAASMLLGAITTVSAGDPAMNGLLSLLLSFLIGAEANNWRRWRMEAAGYREADIIHAESAAVAELRFVHDWLAARPEPSPPTQTAGEVRPAQKRTNRLQPFANPFEPM
jgi:hypothetical protein